MAYDTNLAYDLDFEAYRNRRENKVNEHKRNIKAKKKEKTAANFRIVAISLAIMTVCAMFMISRNVAAYESKRNVESLQKELNELQEYLSQKTFELDKSIDLETVEEIAKTKLNMVRPEKYQTVYVNIKQDDVTEITASETEGIKRFFGIFGSEK